MFSAVQLRRMPTDIEVTLSGDQAAESRFATLKPHQRVPDEVYVAGPKAVDMYLEFLRSIGGRVSPIVEHIEVASVASE